MDMEIRLRSFPLFHIYLRFIHIFIHIKQGVFTQEFERFYWGNASLLHFSSLPTSTTSIIKRKVDTKSRF